MSVGVYSWSTTAASNGAADDNINYAEGQTPASLNNSARAMMAAIKAWGDALGGGITYGGSSNAYTATNNAVGAWAAYASGQVIALKANHTNSGAATLNVDGLGARSIVTADGGALASGDLVNGGIYLLAYDGTNFQVLNTIAGGSYQPLDATLTALAALSWSSGSPLVQFTAADTVSLTLNPSVTNLTLSGVLSVPDGTAAAPSVRVGDEQNGLYSSGANIVAMTAGGAVQASFGLGFITLHSGLFAVNGSAVGPSLSFANDTDCGWYRVGTNNWAGTVGGARFVDISSTLLSFDLPGMMRMADSSETTGALTSASRNRRVVCSGNITLPASGMTSGDTILIDPGGTARTITRPAAHTMYVRDTDSATATSYAHNVVTAVFHGSSKWTLHGTAS